MIVVPKKNSDGGATTMMRIVTRDAVVSSFLYRECRTQRWFLPHLGDGDSACSYDLSNEPSVDE